MSKMSFDSYNIPEFGAQFESSAKSAKGSGLLKIAVLWGVTNMIGA